MSVDIFKEVKTFPIVYSSQIKVPRVKYLEITLNVALLTQRKQGNFR